MANENRLYCGITDLPLSKKGLCELSRLNSQGIYPKEISLYFTSGLLRTEQTLNLLYGPVQREALPQLREYNFGRFEMKSYDILKDRKDYQAWISDSTGNIRCPLGESKNEMVSRVLDGYELLMSKARQSNALLICHGGVIACIMEHLFPKTRNFYEWQPEPGRGYTLVYASGRLQLYKTIDLF